MSVQHISETTARRWYDQHIGIGKLPSGKVWFMVYGAVKPLAWFDDWNSVVIGNRPVVLAGRTK